MKPISHFTVSVRSTGSARAAAPFPPARGSIEAYSARIEKGGV
jgi:hypothetical protein